MQRLSLAVIGNGRGMARRDQERGQAALEGAREGSRAAVRDAGGGRERGGGGGGR